jgi:zinc D-Ala-D-Ala carboxypeptidase
MDWAAFKHFSPSEFACKCGCGRADMRPGFMGRLQALRLAYGKPMIVTSGFRCPNHPVEKAKAAPGAHAQGIAADIGVSGADALLLLRLALEANFQGIGVQQKGSGRFIHLDTREQPAIWSY